MVDLPHIVIVLTAEAVLLAEAALLAWCDIFKGHIDLEHLRPLGLSALEKGGEEEVRIALPARTSHETQDKHLFTSIVKL
jgi:hypothetical protein